MQTVVIQKEFFVAIALQSFRKLWTRRLAWKPSGMSIGASVFNAPLPRKPTADEDDSMCPDRSSRYSYILAAYMSSGIS